MMRFLHQKCLVFIVVALLPAVVLSHRNIDSATLEINVKDYDAENRTISVLAQNSNCWMCPYLEIGTLHAVPGNAVNVTLYSNHTTYIKLSLIHEENKSSLLICQENITVREHAFYRLIVTDQDKSGCRVITVVDGVDEYLPILYMFICLTGLAFIWIVSKQVYKFGRFQFADLIHHESLVQSDLGSTNASPVDHQQQARKSSSRVKSLDTFRGLCLTIMIFVNYGGGQYWFFAHSSWNGLTVADLVFPWFIFIMGTALAFVFNSHHRKGKGKLKLLLQIAVRCIKLFVLGLMINSTSRTSKNDLSKLRIPGVLQRFSLTYLVVALTELVFSGGYTKQMITVEPRWYHTLRDVIYFWPSWLIATVLLLVQIIVTFFVPYDLNNCPTGYVGPGGISEDYHYFNCTGGIAKFIDLRVFGEAHIYQHGTCKKLYECSGTDPEGLLGTLASIFLCFLGVQAGRILVIYGTAKERVLRWLVWAVFLGALALLLSGASQNNGWIPINKNLWSASFVIALGSMAFLLLSLLYVLIDVKEFWSGAPFIYPGMNSIVVYVASEMLADVIPVSFVVSHTHIAQLFINLWSTSFWVMLAAYMYYKKIFISV